MQIAILVGALSSALVIGATLILLNNGGTIYSKKHAPDATVKLTGNEPKQRVGGPLGASDTAEYSAVHVRTGEVSGVQPGKYLADANGKIQYLVDPAINGRLNEQDDGTLVTKYDAPKAALMSFIIDGILSQKMPWSLVLLGVAIALVLELAGIPSLPFAVGVYLPLSASTPIFVGGMLRWLVERFSKKSTADEGDMSPGVLLSSGLIAGGSIAGVVAAVLGLYFTQMGGVGPGAIGTIAEQDWFAMIPFVGVCIFLVLVGGGWLMKPSNSK